MKLPDSASSFVESVISDSRNLISRGLWEIPTARFDSWINQFVGPEEEFFAACLLDHLIFRTSSQFEAGLRSLFRSNLQGKIFAGKSDEELMLRLAGRTDTKLRVVPVIGEDDPPTKSGPLVLRRLQRIMHIRHKWLCWPWQAAKKIRDSEINTVIFVDDFLGSGRQFETFFNQWEFSQLLIDTNYYYASVVAHESGLDHIQKTFPYVKVISAEQLDISHDFFSEDVWSRLGQGTISAAEAKAWYLLFAKEKGLIPRTTGAFGTGDLSLAFGFSHSTPNNSLPIFWYENESTGWQPLLER
ncbi:phosphoribosyltransferase-like protein [Pseudomonas germanica]